MPQTVTVKEVAEFFGVKKCAAQRRLKKIRIALGKRTGVNHSGGADPVTWDELYAHYNIKKP